MEVNDLLFRTRLATRLQSVEKQASGGPICISVAGNLRPLLLIGATSDAIRRGDVFNKKFSS